MKTLLSLLLTLTYGYALAEGAKLKDLSREEIERLRDEVRIPLDHFLPSEVPLLDSDHKEVDRSSLEGKHIGVFVSASWCGPCKYLARFLRKYTQENKDRFSVVFISLDRSPEAHLAYSQSLNDLFFTLPYGHRPKRQLWDLSRKFWLTQNGIPVFIVYDPQGNCLGRKSSEVIDHVQGRKSYLPWAP